MQLPASIYERLPQFWLLLGLLFMSSGTYLGFEYWLTKVYFVSGLICCLWSGWVFTIRLKHRDPHAASRSGQAPSRTDQELSA